MKIALILITALLAGCVAIQPAAPLPPKPTPPQIIKLEPYPSKRFAIKGQVFIATKGGTTVKLSNVKVTIYPREYLEKAIPVIQNYSLELMRYAVAVLRSSPFAGVNIDDIKFERWIPWVGLPDTPLSVTTDADGKFELSGEFPEHFGIVATSKRAVFDKTEYYAWAVLDTEVKDAERVFLSNSNLQL